MAVISGDFGARTEYLFVDGGCLREAVKRLAIRYTGSPDGATVAFDRLRRQFTKVFYYDAVPAAEHEEEREAWLARIRPQTDEFAKIRALPGYHVQLGDLRGRGSRQRQKRVDVQIAVDMLLHTFRSNMDRCTLLAGDVDFQPLLEALIREGMYVTLWHPDQAVAPLLDAADDRVGLSVEMLGDAIRRKDGTVLAAPLRKEIRPRAAGDLRHAWQTGGRAFELTRLHSGEWLLEHFDPMASALSLQLRDFDLRIVVETARDLIALEPDGTVLELIDAEAAPND